MREQEKKDHGAELAAVGNDTPVASPERQVRVIELDPAVWLRGANNGTLLRIVDGKRQQCCIGIACSALGMTDEELGGNSMLEDFSTALKLPAEFDGLYRVEDDCRYDQLTGVYWSNDCVDNSDDQRLQIINEKLSTLRAKFRFVLKGATDGNQAATEVSVTTSASAAQKDTHNSVTQKNAGPQ